MKDSNGKKESKGETWRDPKLIMTLVVCIAAVVSAISASKSAKEALRANQSNIKPYIKFNLDQNPITNRTPVHAVLPYRLENVGGGPAFDIKRSYESYLVKKDGTKKLIQHYDMPIADNLFPFQYSARHPDDINITGFDSIDVSYVAVELKTIYRGDSEIDKNVYFSKNFWGLHPKKEKNRYYFIVSQTHQEYGIETNLK